MANEEKSWENNFGLVVTAQGEYNDARAMLRFIRQGMGPRYVYSAHAASIADEQMKGLTQALLVAYSS